MGFVICLVLAVLIFSILWAAMPFVVGVAALIFVICFCETFLTKKGRMRRAEEKEKRKEAKLKKEQEEHDRILIFSGQLENPKYGFTGNEKYWEGRLLREIYAKRDIYNYKGELVIKQNGIGGYIERMENLDPFDNSWVHCTCILCDSAKIKGDVVLIADAIVCENAIVEGRVKIFNSEIYGNANINGSFNISESVIGATIKSPLQIHNKHASVECSHIRNCKIGENVSISQGNEAYITLNDSIITSVKRSVVLEHVSLYNSKIFDSNISDVELTNSIADNVILMKGKNYCRIKDCFFKNLEFTPNNHYISDISLECKGLEKIHHKGEFFEGIPRRS